MVNGTYVFTLGTIPPGPDPPCQGEPPWDQLPQDQPPLPGRTPPGRENPPPPHGKQTAAYSQWAAGTHPIGMHFYFNVTCELTFSTIHCNSVWTSHWDTGWRYFILVTGLCVILKTIY